MPFSTPLLRRCLAVLSASLGMLTTTHAQTAPGWLSARHAGRGSGPIPNAVTLDAAGNTYEAGTFQASTDVGGTTLPNRGRLDGYLAKYDPTGVLVWIRHFGTPGDDAALGVGVDPAGNAYVAGNFGGTLALGNNVSLNATQATAQAFVVRYSPQGTPEWALTGSSLLTSTASALGFDAAGNLYVTGNYNEPFTLGSASLPTSPTGSVYLARVSAATGAVQSLLHAYHSSGFPAPKLAVSRLGETYFLQAYRGFMYFNHGSYGILNNGTGNQVVAAKFDPQGSFQWVQRIGGDGNNLLGDGAVDAAGNLYLTASYTGQAWHSAQPSSAVTTPLPGLGGYDACLMKYSPTGQVLWVQTAGGTGNDYGRDVALDANGQPYVTGAATYPAQFGPFAMPTTVARGGLTVAAYTDQGQVRWLQTNASGNAIGGHLDLDATGRICVFGNLSPGQNTFGPVSLSAATVEERFLAALSASVLPTRPAVATQPLPLYPNPAHDQLHLSALPAGTAVQLVDALGRTVRTAPVTAGRVSVQGLPAGLYQVRAADAQGRPYAGRVLVE